jgi:hypothetical protein
MYYPSREQNREVAFKEPEIYFGEHTWLIYYV